MGVLRVNTIAELFHMAEVLAKQPRPPGPRLAILTNGGGPGVLATDALIAGGGEIAKLSEESFQKFNEFLPPHWSRGNPVDILGDASAERYSRAIEVLARDPSNDGVLVILTPQAMTECSETARRLGAFGQLKDKPILASWMGGKATADREFQFSTRLTFLRLSIRTPRHARSRSCGATAAICECCMKPLRLLPAWTMCRRGTVQ